MAHVPVMVEEVLKYLAPAPGKNFVDCTLGDGGHSAALLEKNGPAGRVLGFDLDPEAIKVTRENLKRFGERLVPLNASYTDLEMVVGREKFGPIAGVLMDFGFSTPQLEGRGRGFSFQRDEPLDMRYAGSGMMNGGYELTAAEIVNSWPKAELVRVLREYGEERLADRVADAIVAQRRKERFATTKQLAAAVALALPSDYEGGRINPATRTFQALRIAVNDELGSIERVLPQALAVTEAGGAIVTISFHSLEDRLAKTFLKDQAKAGRLELLTDRVIEPSPEEVAKNPRSRSAKLRAAKKIK